MAPNLLFCSQMMVSAPQDFNQTPETSPARSTRFAAGGFTLIEVVFAAAIFAIFMAALFEGSAKVSALLTSQRETHEANLALQERVELIRGATFSQITSPTYVQNTLMSTATTSAGMLNAPIELITLSAYPTPSGSNLVVMRQNGAATLITTNSTLSSAAAVQVNYALAWTSNIASKSRNRQITLIIANGGIDN